MKKSVKKSVKKSAARKPLTEQQKQFNSRMAAVCAIVKLEHISSVRLAAAVKLLQGLDEMDAREAGAR